MIRLDATNAADVARALAGVPAYRACKVLDASPLMDGEAGKPASKLADGFTVHECPQYFLRGREYDRRPLGAPSVPPEDRFWEGDPTMDLIVGDL